MVANLMTNTPARDAFTNAVQSIAGRITGAGADIQVQIGTLPAGALILGTNTNVETVIGGTAPVFNVGTTPTGAQIASAIALTAGTVVTPPVAALANPIAADTPVYANISGGGATTSGDAYVTVQFIKPVS